MKKEYKKLYFENKESTWCQPLEYFLAQTKNEELKEITLIEAVLDKGANSTVWCRYNGKVVERMDCSKLQCDYYEANKSGRGTCIHRGNMYLHGEEKTFIIS